MIQQLKNNIPHILVIGDLMIDHYLLGNCERISPEAPVQVVDIQEENLILGGAGNVINNLIALEAQVSVASVIGNDKNAQELLQLLHDIDINTEFIVYEQGRKTSKKSRVLASSQQIMRFDKESKDNIAPDSQKALYQKITNLIPNIDAVILSDYAKGVLTTQLVKKIITLAKAYHKKVFVDPKGEDYSKYTGAYLLTPNKKEASIATGIDIVDNDSLEQALLKLKKTHNLDLSMITLSEGGIAYYDHDLHIIPTITKEVYDVTGAGDTVIASLAYALSINTTPVAQAVKFANLAAGVVVSKIGSATAAFDEIEEYEASLHQSKSDAHIKTLEEIKQIVQRLKEKKRKIVFTNGCFDILHIGHVKYLQEAKSFGDILIVGLNSDLSVKKLKGNDRPVNAQYDRAYILAALDAVDYVVIFDEETPYNLIHSINPHILVKGGDYKDKIVVGSDLVEEVKLVNFIEGKSTTRTIQKILGDIC